MDNNERQPASQGPRRPHGQGPSHRGRPGNQGRHGFSPAGPHRPGTDRRLERAFRDSKRGRPTRAPGAHHQLHMGGAESGSATGNGTEYIPPIAEGVIRVIPLGGVEEIGRNMSLVEYGNDIIIVDCGFQFKEEDTPGIDFILPNTKYLEDHRSKIRAIVITHGHLDHIGAIPYLMDRIGNPPIYSRRLTTLMIKKRQEEFPHLPALDIREVEKDDVIKIGGLTIKFFAVTHTIPDSMGVMIGTPYGVIVNTGDLKLEHNDGIPIAH